MKIVAVISSPMPGGNTAVLARRALDGAREAGAEVCEIFLADKRVEFCRGCFLCMSTGHCPVGDDFEELRAMVYESDGIILASPVYGLNPNARMKNFWVDRMGMFSVYTTRLSGKYFLGLSTGGVFGASKVARNLAMDMTFGVFGKGFSSGSLGLAIGRADSMKCRIEEHPAALDKAYRLGKKLADDINAKRKYPFQSFAKAALMHLVPRPMMIRNIRRNKEGFLKAVYQDLASRGIMA